MTHNDIFLDLTEKAKSHEYFYHYTTLDTLQKIISSRALLLNKISNVRNDPMEYGRLNNSLYADRLYVACFTFQPNETIEMWKEYTKSSSEGVRLCFPNLHLINDFAFFDENKQYKFEYYKTTDINCRSYSKMEDWLIKDCRIANIHYTEELKRFNHFDEELYADFGTCQGYSKNAFCYPVLIGLVKENRFEYETEVRIRVAITPRGPSNSPRETPKPPPNMDRMFLQLPDKVFQDLIITTSPYAKTQLKGKIGKLLSSFTINIKQSCLIP